MSRLICRTAAIGCLIVASCAASQTTGREARQPSPPAAASSHPVELTIDYHPFAAFSAQLHELASRAASNGSLQSLATTSAGRELWLLTLAAAGDRPPEDRDAILIVGGIDADCPAGSETALNVARRLIDAMTNEPDGKLSEMLRQRTIYIVPRANPDGIETYFEPVKYAARVNARPVDDDRDAVVNEDSPNDLNGDGQITVMRVPDPEGEWIVDKDEPRLMKKADPSKGEDGIYKLVLEGIDDDNDGQINEDGPGGVDNDRNWPHLFESGVIAAGAVQLSEPESRALAQFVVDHPRIAAAIVYGRHDNIVKVSKDKDRGPDGESYRDLNPDDVKTYEHISEKYKEITGLKGSAGTNAAGALYAWLYSQRGIPTFATSLWWPVEKPEPASQPASAPADDAKPGGDDNGPAPDGPPGRPSRVGRRGGGPPGGRGGPPGGGPGNDDADNGGDLLAERVASSETLKKWLAYSDEQRDGAGYVNWAEVDHPTLGKVEVGGLGPYFETTPPVAELDTIAEAQTNFVQELSSMLAQPKLDVLKVESLGADVWSIELNLHNDGYLPTHLAIARQTQQPPFAVRPMVDADRIVGGKRIERVPYLDGSGGAAKLTWLIRGKPGDTVRFRAFNRVHGELLLDVSLTDQPSTQESE